jgi:hypothetical protein
MDAIMNSTKHTTELNDNSATNKSTNMLSGLAKKSRARFILIALFAVTVMAGTHEVRRFQFSREWVTVSLPNPPAPLPDAAAPSAAQMGITAR